MCSLLPRTLRPKGSSRGRRARSREGRRRREPWPRKGIRLITLLLFVCVAAVVLARLTAPAPDRPLAKISEAVRLRLAAALLDLGNHLMLCAEERRALRLRKRLSSARARRLGLYVAAAKAGARRLDEVTLEIPIGE